MKFSLSVVVPAYNEEANVKACIHHIVSVLHDTDWDWELLIVDDGSKDRTRQIAQQEIKSLRLKNARVLYHRPNRGYGGALKRGFTAAHKEFIVFVPADNQFDFTQIHLLIAAQRQTSADIVSGIRPHGGHDPWHRLFFRWSWNTLVRALFGYLATDIDCGFKLFRRSLLKRLTLSSDGAMIDTQLFAGSRTRGLKISEVELRHFPRTAGKSTGGNPKVVFKALRELLVFWWQLKQEILVEQGRVVFRWEAIFLLLILVVAAYSRLYRISDYQTFLGDEGRDAIVMRNILLGRHFPAIGPGTSIGNMYLGPLYYYLAAPSLALSNFSPVGPAVFVAGVGLLTLALLWWLSRQWFGRVNALLVSFLYALSPTVIVYSRSSWNPNIMPFFALVCMYGIWKVWRLGYWRWLIITAASFAFVLNSHYLGLLLLPPLGLFWLLAYLSQKPPAVFRHTLISIAVFSLLLSPLLVFDARHDWQNFSAIRQFFTQRQTTVNLKIYKALPHLWPVWQDVNTSLLAAKISAAGQAVSVSFLVLWPLAFIRPSSTRKDLFLVTVWLVFGVVGLGLYKQHIYDHYFGFLFPAPFLLLGFSLQFLSRSKILLIPASLLVLLLFTVNLKNHPLRYPPNLQLDHTRAVAEFIRTSAASQPFNLALISKSNYDASYRYFLETANAPYFTIHDHLSEQLFVICEPHPDIDCDPIGHPLWEIAAFGWAKITNEKTFPWGVTVSRLVHNPEGK